MASDSRLDIVIPEELHAALRVQAVIEGTSLKAVAVRAIAEYVNGRNAQSRAIRVEEVGERQPVVKRSEVAEATATQVKEAFGAPRPAPKPLQKRRKR